MSLLPLALACGPYDRTRALADGRVTVAGVDLRYLTLDPEEIFFRMIGHGEFDLSEMSMATYHALRDKAAAAGEPAPFVAIPVFPSRMGLRH
jgi:4,5-dihydroxyphthalate decarboxylase